MIAAEVSTAGAILGLVGLGLGIVIAVVVVTLFDAILRALREIRRYAEAILDGGVGVARNLDGLEEMGRTDELTSTLAGLPDRELERLRGSQP